MNRTSLLLCATLFTAIAAPAGAQSSDQNLRADTPIQLAQATAPMTDGEIRKVDMDAGKITIRHAPIEELGMPAMTMVFQVSDPAMLDKVKAGDKVRFNAARTGGAFTVMQLEPVR